MSQIEQVKSFINERLKAAAEEILGIFEKVIKDHKEKDSRSEMEIEHQKRLLDLLLKPDKLHTADPPQLSVCKEELPPDQEEGSLSLDQEDPEPPLIKEEEEETWTSQEREEETWTSQEREQLQWLEETDTKDSIFTLNWVRSLRDQYQYPSPHFNQTVENREGEPLPSTSTEQMKTEADREDCGDSKPTGDCQPLSSDHSVAESEDTDGDEDRMESGGSKGKTSMESFHLKSDSQDAVNCKVCGKSFTYHARFMNHVRKHIKDTPCVCGVCGKLVESTDSLVNHLKSHKKARIPQTYRCSVCHKELGSNSKRAVHMRIHTGEKPYNCSVCSKRFTQAGHLRRHTRSHTGEKPHKCSVCGKEFIQAGNLKTHMRSHTGERPYNCSICGKRFTQAGDVKIHMRIHTGEKPYMCSVCGKGFIQTGSLKTHMRSHTGERPYNCSVCGKEFTQAGDLKIHLRIHTGEKVYTCSFCGKGFHQIGNMKCHMKIHTKL